MVSEFMLQQTTVAAVVPYFQRWMERFPTLESLAAAKEHEVLGLWQGLGYYSRARNLLRSAALLAARGGKIPDSREELLALPGFGEYTASAVLAFAFDRPVPVVDANITRVLARLGDIREPVDQAAGKAAILRLAGNLVPASKGGRDHTSALMDLGSTICTPRTPQCGRCPVRGFCSAGDPASLPVKRPRPEPTRLSDRRAFVMRRQSLALVPSPGPQWRGLWLLPAAAIDGELLHTEIYPITRYRVEMSLVAGAGRPQGAEFFPVDDLPPMPSPHARAVAAVLARVHSDGP